MAAPGEGRGGEGRGGRGAGEGQEEIAEVVEAAREECPAPESAQLNQVDGARATPPTMEEGGGEGADGKREKKRLRGKGKRPSQAQESKPDLERRRIKRENEKKPRIMAAATKPRGRASDGEESSTDGHDASFSRSPNRIKLK
eukprot:757593-Hanusia_phi.AAC.2